MGFTFNGSGNNYSILNNAVDAIGPENTGLAHIAQTRMDNIISRSNAKYIEALKVDGIYLTIWIKQQAGYPCTCLKQNTPISGLVAGTNTNGKYSNNTTDNLPSPLDNTFKITRVIGTDLVPITNDPEFDFLNPVIKSPLVTDNIPANDLIGVDLNATNDQTVDNLESGTQLGEVNLDEDVDEFFAGDVSGAVFGGDKTACGICFTTGWTDGYHLLNGQRIVFDASGSIPFTLNGTVIDTNEHPYKFILPENNGVYWKFEFPAYCQSWVNFRARNNLSAADNITIQYSTDGINWYLLTLDILNQTSNTGTARVWYIRAIKTVPFVVSKFTHLEFVVITSNPTVAQSPNLTYPTNFDAFDAIVNTQFEIAPTIAHLPRESVFMDSKYGLMWKVVDVVQNSTSKSQIFGYQVTCRLVQRHEQLYQLHDLYVETPPYLLSGDNSTQAPMYPYSNIPYAGLQKIQGNYGVIIRSEMTGGVQQDNQQLISNYTLIFQGPSLDDTSPNPIVSTNDQIILGPDGNVWIQGDTSPNLDASVGSLYSDTNNSQFPLSVSLGLNNWANIAFTQNSQIYSLPSLVIGNSYSWSGVGKLIVNAVFTISPTSTENALAEMDISPDGNTWLSGDSFGLFSNSPQTSITLHLLVPAGWYYRISPQTINASLTSSSAIVLS